MSTSDASKMGCGLGKFKDAYEMRIFKDYAKLNEERQVILAAIRVEATIDIAMHLVATPLKYPPDLLVRMNAMIGFRNIARVFLAFIQAIR